MGRRERVRRGGYPTRAAAPHARDEALGWSREDANSQAWTVKPWLRYWPVHPGRNPADNTAAGDPGGLDPRPPGPPGGATVAAARTRPGLDFRAGVRLARRRHPATVACGPQRS